MPHRELSHPGERHHHQCGCGGGGECGCGGGCGCGHGEFVRMRYYYGQLLGATDLSDEQAYLVGKRRFHNVRLHGWGVLCGLRVERYSPPPSADTTPATILRVLSGAAIDRCGNEIIVPGDYCIDVNAWLLTKKPDRNKILNPQPPTRMTGPTTAPTTRPTSQPSTAPATAPSTQPTRDTDGQGIVYVVLRYEECPSEPSFAPRDPCGCDDGGCEFARVRESFKLDLITADKLTDAPNDPPFPWVGRDETDVLDEFLDASGAALRERAAAPCKYSAWGGWLVLAEVPVVLESGRVTDVRAPRNDTDWRRVLLSTAALQWAASAGAWGEGFQRGPTFLRPQVQSTTRIRLPLRLVKPAGSTAATPIEPTTVKGPSYWASVFRPGTGWTDLTLTVTPDADGDALILDTATPLAVDNTVRISVEQRLASPICDTAGRALTPLRWGRTFLLQASTSDGFVLTDLPN
jgi:hypothetical protein